MSKYQLRLTIATVSLLVIVVVTVAAFVKTATT